MKHFRRWLLRSSGHACRTLPASTSVQIDLPCPGCGWHVTGLLQAETDGNTLMTLGILKPYSLDGPVKMLLNHYDLCESVRAKGS